MQTGNAESRLLRLENFLRHDPHNPHLLADTFDAAMSAADFVRATTLIDTARVAGLEAPAWTFREVNLRIAQGRAEEARMLLQGLQATEGEHPAIAHNLAYIDFIQGDFAECAQRLQPWVSDEAPSAAPLDVAQLAALQTLWLRALHRLARLEQAWAWVQAQLQRGQLSPPAAGVASLVAVDADHLAAVVSLADAALAKDPHQMEALVARATVALAARDAPLARKFLGAALAHNPRDGRALSALGFTELLSGEIAKAASCMDQAVAFMPAHVGTWLGLGWARVMEQNLEGARAAFDRALALDRNFSESHGGLAVVHAIVGNPKEATASIERALGLDAACLSAHYAKALLAGEAKDARALQVLARRLLGGWLLPLAVPPASGSEQAGDLTG